ncbi:hypothetical protein [Pseudooceanicola sp. LIPI14-2-Ac024]
MGLLTAVPDTVEGHDDVTAHRIRRLFLAATPCMRDGQTMLPT